MTGQHVDAERFLTDLDDWLAANTAQLVAWRRDFHSHPELSRSELRTTGIVVDELTKAGLSPRILPQGVGVVCDIGPAGPLVALRADMDALPIGVRLIFQAAEEVMPGGALDAVTAGVTRGVSQIYALHCDPKLEVGKVGLRRGPITSAADHVELVLHSPGGHTSRPHLTADLVYAMGSVITGLPGILSRRIDPRTSTVMVWGSVHAGDAPNAIPQEGRLRGTVRTGDHATWALLEPLVREIIEGLLAPLSVRYDMIYKRGVPPVVNDSISTEIFRDAILSVSPDALADTAQSGGGEDFSWYLENVPGAMARLGVWSGHGQQVDLHQPNFDLDERALAVGVRTLAGVVLQASLRNR